MTGTDWADVARQLAKGAERAQAAGDHGAALELALGAAGLLAIARNLASADASIRALQPSPAPHEEQDR